MDKFALVATLNNDKKILVEPDQKNMKCAYRYLSDRELENMQLNMNRKYIWNEVPIYKTVDDGKTVFFSTVEATPIVFARI